MTDTEHSSGAIKNAPSPEKQEEIPASQVSTSKTIIYLVHTICLPFLFNL